MKNVVATTGHVPKHCPCKYNENHPWLIDLKQRLLTDLSVGWQNKEIKCVISGLSIGFDMWVAETALEIGIPVHCHLPFQDQGAVWPTETKQRHANLVSRCERVVTISKQYHNKAFYLRDRGMVDEADIVIALLNDKLIDSGTYHTVEYAKSKNIHVENYWRD